MSETLAGKVAIVTGGGRGMGRATVLGPARAGGTISPRATPHRQWPKMRAGPDAARSRA